MRKIRILVIRYRFIGDTLLTVPFLRNLRYAYPDAQIDMLVAPVSGDIIKECPYVDNFLYFDTTRKHRYENPDEEKKTFIHYVKMLRENNYDKAYILKRSFSSAALAFLAGIKERIGFSTEGRGFLLTKKIPYKNQAHEIECFLDILKEDGIEIKDDYLENWITDEEARKAKNILSGINAKKVLVHATSGNRNKEWAKENFAGIIEFLSNEKEAQVIYLGTRNDSQTYDEIHKFIKSDLKIPPLNLCGELNLRESLALTKQCDLIVGCDSGNLHIAASAGVPVVGIYGPMDEKKWGAWGKNNILLKADVTCRPCGLKSKCKFNSQCLTQISQENVKASIEKLI